MKNKSSHCENETIIPEVRDQRIIGLMSKFEKRFYGGKDFIEFSEAATGGAL